jgi:triosephosphate isomerase (TIM)
MSLTPPFFEFGPKNLLRLPEILDVAAAAQDAGARCGVSVLVTVPTALIGAVRAAVPDVLVFAQHMDVDEPGPSVGRVTAESLADAGAHGVMLNHACNPLDPSRLPCALGRAHANDLMTMVCAGTGDEVRHLLPLRPTVVLFEPPDLIGHTGGADRPWIRRVDAEVRTAAPGVLVLHAGGVGTPEDAYSITRSGAAGTGATSGVLRAGPPARTVGRFVAAVRRGFDDHQEAEEGER